MKNKTILIFTGYFLPHLGGIERYIDNFMREIKKLGYTPVLVTSNHDNLKEKEEIDGTYIYRIPIYNIFKERYPIPKKNNKLKSVLNELSNYNITSVIVNTRFHLTSHIGIKYAKSHNLPVHLIEHGSNYVTLDNKFIDFFANRYEDFLTIKIKNKVDAFHGVSLACNEWLKHFGIKAGNVWYNSIDCNQKLPRKNLYKNIINFMYAGRLIKQKGVENILKAFTKLEKKYNNIHLFIAGNGPEYAYYKDMYKSKNIEFLGKLDYDTLLKYYAKTNIFLYPPLWPEGLPTSMLEAGLMECVLVGTKQGGIKEILDGTNGIMVDETEIGLYNAMEKLINNEQLRNKLSKKIKEDINKKFSWEVTAKKILKDMEVE